MTLRDVAARVERISGYSGHADQARLTEWVVHEYNGRPKLVASKIFLVHGTDAARYQLKIALAKKIAGVRRSLPFFAPKCDVLLPTEKHTWFDLEQGEWTEEEANTLATLRGEILTLRDENVRLKDERDQLRRELNDAEDRISADTGNDPLLDRLVSVLIPLTPYSSVKRGEPSRSPAGTPVYTAA